MCTVCGCASQDKNHGHHDHSQKHHHHHQHKSDHQHLHFGRNDARTSVCGLEEDRIIEIERDILDKNTAFATANRTLFQDHSQFTINLLSSPGAGKTSLLVKTIEELHQTLPIVVIEGDQETSNDAERIRETGVHAVQINTGKGCHLDAHMIGHAIEHVDFKTGGLTIIENVGNLVCPAAFDLGESSKVVILSVTEGEDKPIKYPDMFAVADLMILSKADLLPYVKFNVDQAIEYAHRVNPGLRVIELSVETSIGIDEWTQWLLSGVHASHQNVYVEQEQTEVMTHA
ncbi:MAG: hydrogenase nickel incorporation protein HypB [Gammaproteobacteria bacterium]|nr:hydrogenase nickel incorporation protein HypB [Gammaproteobacteria bacterium]MCY4218013.1 hydrogenase nickel incorporation protein HypB [Gammaproteobacteria bacterium]MCY4274414.1 hydrogenase nickel incorporation protein HypB [Gammaproteobacteria bacterium]